MAVNIDYVAVTAFSLCFSLLSCHFTHQICLSLFLVISIAAHRVLICTWDLWAMTEYFCLIMDPADYDTFKAALAKQGSISRVHQQEIAAVHQSITVITDTQQRLSSQSLQALIAGQPAPAPIGQPAAPALPPP